MKTVISKAVEIVTPSEKEEKAVLKEVESVIEKVNKAARISRVKAELIVGGSVGKGSWLSGIHDLDFFLLFDYATYKDKSGEISDITDRVLSKAFAKYTRLHGSRDYFEIKTKKLVIEIIPVLKIKNIKDAKNITDASPLHVGWIKKHTKKNKQLVNDMRLAKQFFVAQRAYGAESFIQGFSGHVIEILVCQHGSFEKLIKKAKGWKGGEVIDVEKHYKSSKAALEALNVEKKKSPIIILDPVESNRNAVASLREKVFTNFVKSCEAFCKKPSIDFFVEKKVVLGDLKKAETKTSKLVTFKAVSERGKIDIVGSRIKKRYTTILDLFQKNGFEVRKHDWYWNKKSPALFYFYVNPKELSKKVTLKGPLTYGPSHNIVSFKKKYRRKKISRIGYNYYVEAPRDLRKIKDVLKVIKKDKTLAKVKLLK